MIHQIENQGETLAELLLEKRTCLLVQCIEIERFMRWVHCNDKS